jgi:Bacterial aa3 type cytochrome c oxidase subunit IV
MAQTGEYHRGEMPVADQRSTYTLFNQLVHWCGASIAALVAFLTIWLSAHAGFLTGLIVAVVIMAVATFMSRKPGH